MLVESVNVVVSRESLPRGIIGIISSLITELEDFIFLYYVLEDGRASFYTVCVEPSPSRQHVWDYDVGMI